MVTIVDLDGFPEELDEALNDGRPKVISAWGRKGSGKSVFNRRLYHSWAGDKLCIDVNGNAEPGPDAERIGREDLTGKWPAQPVDLGGQRRRPRNLWFRADPGDATYVDDLDRALGLALFPQDRPVMVWAGECGDMMPKGRTGPNMRRVLQQNRHHKVTCLFDGPRPVDINPLTLSQSDFVAIYHLPNPNDRRRVADSIGYNPRQFDEVCEDTWRQGPYWYLLWHAEAHQLYQMAPIPLDDEEAA